MEALWIALAFLLACLGGWPITAGVLKFAKSHPVRSADAREQDSATDAEASAEVNAEAGQQGVDNRSLDNQSPDNQGTGGQSTGSRDSSTLPAGVLRGGLLIGMLERGAVVLAILTGQSVAVAYVVAIKGLGRYPELKAAPEASERFIIGTLASMLWAAGVATLVQVLLL